MTLNLSVSLFEKLVFAESDVRMLEYADIYLEDVTVEPLVENSFEYLQMKNPLQNIHAQPNNFLKKLIWSFIRGRTKFALTPSVIFFATG